MSRVIKSELVGIRLLLRMLMRCVDFLRKDFVIFICGCKSLSKKAEAVYVGPFVHEIIGLSRRGFLCNLGRK